MASPTRGSAPWTPDGVPPLSLALRGGRLLYNLTELCDWPTDSASMRDSGTDKMESGAYWPRRASHDEDIPKPHFVAANVVAAGQGGTAPLALGYLITNR